jgi:hypothetical protein
MRAIRLSKRQTQLLNSQKTPECGDFFGGALSKKGFVSARSEQLLPHARSVSAGFWAFDGGKHCFDSVSTRDV